MPAPPAFALFDKESDWAFELKSARAIAESLKGGPE
jgi:hypothetical protein